MQSICVVLTLKFIPEQELCVTVLPDFPLDENQRRMNGLQKLSENRTFRKQAQLYKIFSEFYTGWNEKEVMLLKVLKYVGCAGLAAAQYCGKMERFPPKLC